MEEDKPKTAFICPLGFYEFNWMWHAHFPEVNGELHGDINLREVLVFLDDLVIFSDSLKENENRLGHVLHRLR